MKVVGYITIGIVVIVALIALAFVFELGGLQWKKFFAPKHENVRREVFEETRSYNEAKTQDLARYKLQYERSNDIEEKEAIAATIRHTFANYDAEKLPVGLASFLRQIRGY